MFGCGATERYLDPHRFWSDETIGKLEDLNDVRKRNMHNLPTASNLWDTAGRKGFGYYKSCKDFIT